MYTKLIILTSLLAISHSRVLDNNYIYDIIKNRVQFGSRIIGGRDAVPGEYPHQVSLQLGIKDIIPFIHFCGGSIIYDKYILTAAHCLDAVEELRETYPQLEFLFAVKAGKQDLSQNEPTEQASIVENYVKHEKWNPKLPVGPYDISILKLKTPLVLNKRVAKIRLPQENSEPIGSPVLSGWGAIKDDPKNPLMPTILQSLNTSIITREVCDKAIEQITTEAGQPIKDIIHETNICTGPIVGGYSACGGDSGGPLILNAEDDEPEVVGIVSWGMVPCGRKGAPTVYTKVSVYIDWIKNAINKI